MAVLENPDLGPREGWTPIQLIQHLLKCRSFVSGDPDGDRLRIRYYRRESDRALVGRVWFGPAAEGPPGHAHGGSISAVMDESLAAAAWNAGYAVLSKEITVRYRRPIKLGSVATIEAWVEKADLPEVIARGRLVGDDGEPYCEAELLLKAP